jgi:hypothetical protein
MRRDNLIKRKAPCREMNGREYFLSVDFNIALYAAVSAAYERAVKALMTGAMVNAMVRSQSLAHLALVRLDARLVERVYAEEQH